jgi:hypothetical protein
MTWRRDVGVRAIAAVLGHGASGKATLVSNRRAAQCDAVIPREFLTDARAAAVSAAFGMQSPCP